MSSSDADEVVRAYLDAVGALDLEALADTLADDVVMDLPYAPPGFPRRVEGKADVTAFFAGMPAMITPLRFHDYRLDALADDPGSIVAQYASDARILATDRPYRNSYIARFRVRGGAITWFAEYFDPVTLVEALGGTVTMPGQEVPT
ncbi:ketosteroid isomerase-like protein [Actinomycetospora succinea]|uniref:Ketosteroid isomerase-like protein n=1 Tax=Actinomycetospora succinea TaxID=663603 RepID=A0A4R6VGY3_9PSEU|nr:nuclear transport factor 2 family protein [Actinomycetospora succinea]TDQ62467.1 ketosteroid isomerase-like protein [Actinomycetospora succinea]